MKELRSEYAAAVTACAERIAGALFQRPGYSINATLHRHGISGTPSIMQQQVSLLHLHALLTAHMRMCVCCWCMMILLLPKVITPLCWVIC